jgi:hypothetical protein
LIEKSCARVVVHEVKGISKCFEYINPTENDTSVSTFGHEMINTHLLNRNVFKLKVSISEACGHSLISLMSTI